ncbi:MAG: 50S ribosomal protein L23 [Candidatus Actinomarina sp.]|jgi:large subunit ribosomal protein L23|nr:50S ribosomal protein L23 [Actinomycetota bacterium]MDC3033279.1 50S ribosomal protein L23 [Acidimicrobiaceae bacterium]MDC3226651.1 50S ribosomal protein L23 [Acidimicrobiaceae bacterium]|tara:strand:- start:2016 stop:2303 length:288 start_codon:yes stop_codon:yes gene_type:complete
MKYLEDVLIQPLISEKSYDRIADSNSYTFFVHTSSTKPEIKRAVEEIFEVDVLSVNTMYKKGKKKRFGYVLGQQSTRKVAIVTLGEGQTIEAFGV